MGVVTSLHARAINNNSSSSSSSIGATAPWDASRPTLEMVGDQVRLVPSKVCNYFCYFLLSTVGS